MKKSIIALVVLSFICSGFVFNYTISHRLKKLLHNWAEVPKGQVEIANERGEMDSFYMQKTEVTNSEYLTYLLSLSEPERSEALPDTNVWKSGKVAQSSYVNMYLRYPGFRNFPLVGISHEQANKYCMWLEGEINSQLDTGETVKVRLPTEAEWKRAARGDNHSAMYTWGSPYVKNSKGKLLANFKAESLVKLPTKKNLITAEVESFVPNSFGIYQMCGNVAEMTDKKGEVKGGSWESEAEDMKIDKSQMVSSPSRSVGFRPILIVKN